MTRLDIDRADIQALVYSAFGSLSGASYLLLRVTDPPSARRWLGALEIASVDDLRSHRSEVTQIAVTAAGLRALGVAEPTVQRFNPEFIEGMAGNPNRSQRLGDTGSNAPDKWVWGVGDSEPHV